MNSPTTYYGKYVTNYNSPNDEGIINEDNQLGKWQIFMADEDSIYLIASNYITAEYTGKKNNIGYYTYNTAAPTKMWFNNMLGQYNVGPTTTDIPEILSKLDKQTIYHKWMNNEDNQKRNYSNEKAVSSMLDITVWNGYNNSNYAKYAIGGPTIEMFCKSYNDSRIGNMDKLEAQETNNVNTYGYVILKGKTNQNNNVSGLKNEATELADRMYFKTSSVGNNYWLASTAGSVNSGYILYISDTGAIRANGYNNTAICFRPLVCLKSHVHIVEKTNGNTKTYELELD